LREIELGSTANPLNKVNECCKRISGELRTVAFSLRDVDGEWLFLESYDPKVLRNEYGKEFDSTMLANAASALSGLFRISDKLGIDRPSKYYAVLTLDGDEMGKWLSGHNLPPFRSVIHPKVVEQLKKYQGSNEWRELIDENSAIKRPLAPSTHLAISSALNNFSLKLVRMIVEEEHLGKLVYAGGDDVLAFVSLKNALEIARKLRAAFSGFLNEEGKVDWSQESGYIKRPTSNGREEVILTMGKTATASAGIAVAHHLAPLQTVMHAARQAEKYAKTTLGRDAFALTIMKRSGEDTTAGAKWLLSKSDRVDSIDALGCLVECFREGIISKRFVADIIDETAGLLGVRQEARLLEVRRLFNRHTQSLKPDERESAWKRAILPFFEYLSIDNAVTLLRTGEFLSRRGAK
jgi:CRISPR-associated protein Cmr2